MTDKKDNDSDDKKKKPKNPWGNAGNDDKKRSNGHHGSGGHFNHSHSDTPDIDTMLRKAQDNFRDVMPGNGPLGGSVGILAVIALIALWLASGFYIVNPGEHAVIQRFGAWTRTQADPGLGYHMPAPIETRTIVNVEEIRKMNIGFTERQTRSGMQRMDVAEESQMLTSDRNIVDLDLVIQWNIKSSEDYLFEIHDQENTIKKVAESAIREVAGQTNMFPIITNQRQEVANRTKDIIQKNLDEYNSGVNISNVLIENAEVHPDVQDAFQDVQSAKQDAEDMKNRAEAYREDILPKARGQAIKMLQDAEAYKQSVIARSQGDADRFDAVYEAYLSGKDVTKERIYIETMEKVLGNAQKIILDKQSGEGVVPYLPLNELSTPTPSKR